MFRKKKFNQQRKAGMIRRGFTDEVSAKFPAQLSQGAAFQRAIGNSTVIPGKLRFTDGIARNLTRIDRSKVAGAPHTLVKLRMQP